MQHKSLKKYLFFKWLIVDTVINISLKSPCHRRLATARENSRKRPRDRSGSCFDFALPDELKPPGKTSRGLNKTSAKKPKYKIKFVSIFPYDFKWSTHFLIPFIFAQSFVTATQFNHSYFFIFICGLSKLI